jgi:hypothetical protein
MAVQLLRAKVLPEPVSGMGAAKIMDGAVLRALVVSS